ncbi:hypothetical protein HCB17_23525 [Salinispora arenicola]|uniref:hypothetical protein n=1 Tax=Salinispora arenicola TaxID=168697 RepID=UPI0016B773FE|nr:hypothetical protein [Salinispora arenicola]NIL43756.1 hypothetical protein [Salinispora arenicola]
MAPCPVRAFAASVIAAAGEDPRWYDAPRTPPTPDEPDSGRTLPERIGWAVGGRSVPLNAEGLLYEREN